MDGLREGKSLRNLSAGRNNGRRVVTISKSIAHHLLLREDFHRKLILIVCDFYSEIDGVFPSFAFQHKNKHSRKLAATMILAASD